MPPNETLPDKRPFGKEERQYLYKLLPAMQNPVQVSTVRMWLEKAQADGLDPQRLYEAAVAVRPPHWMIPPTFTDVMMRTE